MGNLSSSSTVKPTSIESCRHLFTAYINQSDEYIIPKTIINLCLNYYYPLTIMVWLNHIPEADQHPIYITDIHDINKHWTCSLRDIQSNKNNEEEEEDVITTPSYWNMYCNAVCLAKNIDHCIPKQITDSIVEYYHNQSIGSKQLHSHSIRKLLASNPYHILFKSGGLLNDHDATDNCNAIIFNDVEFQCNPQKTTQNNIVCFNWKLPNLPLALYGNDFVYSNVYGLLSIGGIVDGVYLSG
eukprot:124736_1